MGLFLFFCVLAPEGMNAIVFREKDGEGNISLSQ
jgi:acetyl-CoA carboxylase alpha subunit